MKIEIKKNVRSTRKAQTPAKAIECNKKKITLEELHENHLFLKYGGDVRVSLSCNSNYSFKLFLDPDHKLG